MISYYYLILKLFIQSSHIKRDVNFFKRAYSVWGMHIKIMIEKF